MIIPNHEHHLGIKSLVVSCFRSTFSAVVLFFIAVFLSAVSGPFITTMNGLINNYEQSNGGNNFDCTSIGFGGISLVFILSFLVFVINLISSWLRYENFTFNFGEFEIKLKKGILNIEEISIPYHQASNVHVDRDLLYRLFGVSRLVINTAGHEDSGNTWEEEATFDPIDKGLAEEMQSMLQTRVGVQIIQQKK